MKILYVTDVFEGSPLIHTYEICKNLTELGDEIADQSLDQQRDPADESEAHRESH